MPITHDVDTWDGETLLTTDGDKIGQIEGIYLDDAEQPAWLAVKTGGLFGSAVSLVPVQRATPSDDGVTVPYDKQHIKDAPTFKPDDEISDENVQALYEHYAIGSPEPRESVESVEPVEPAPDSVEAPTIAREPVNQANL